MRYVEGYRLRIFNVKVREGSTALDHDESSLHTGLLLTKWLHAWNSLGSRMECGLTLPGNSVNSEGLLEEGNPVEQQ